MADDGNDTIQNSGESSAIYASFGDDIITNTGDSVQVDDGGSLMLANGADMTFKLADGSSYRADYNSHSWRSND